MSASDRAKRKEEVLKVNAEHHHPEYEMGPSISELMEQQETAIRELVMRRSREQERLKAEADKRGVPLAVMIRERFSRMDQKQQVAKADGTFRNRLLALRKDTSEGDAWEEAEVPGVRVNVVSLGGVGKLRVSRSDDGSEFSTMDDGMHSKLIFSATELEALLVEDPQLREPYTDASGESKRIIYSIVDAEHKVWLLTE